jgi:hypothetical protein
MEVELAKTVIQLFQHLLHEFARLSQQMGGRNHFSGRMYENNPL